MMCVKCALSVDTLGDILITPTEEKASSLVLRDLYSLYDVSLIHHECKQ